MIVEYLLSEKEKIQNNFVVRANDVLTAVAPKLSRGNRLSASYLKTPVRNKPQKPIDQTCTCKRKKIAVSSQRKESDAGIRKATCRLRLLWTRKMFFENRVREKRYEFKKNARNSFSSTPFYCCPAAISS